MPAVPPIAMAPAAPTKSKPLKATIFTSPPEVISPAVALPGDETNASVVSSITVTENEPAIPAFAPTDPPIEKIPTSFGDSASIDTPLTPSRPLMSLNEVPSFAEACTSARPSIHALVLLTIVTLVIAAPTLAPPLTANCPAIAPACALFVARTRMLPAAVTTAAPPIDASTVSAITLTVTDPATAALPVATAKPMAKESIELSSFASTVILPRFEVMTELPMFAVILFAMKFPDSAIPTPLPPTDIAAPPVKLLIVDSSCALTVISPSALITDAVV